MSRSSGLGGLKVCILFLCLMLILFTCVWYKGQDLPRIIQRFSTNLSGGQNETFIPRQESSTTNRLKVICMILTRVSNWDTKGKAVRHTWAQRCHKTLYFYTKVDNCSSQSICKEPNAIGLNVPDGRDHLTGKTVAALRYSYDKYASEANYFLKADDDTYVIMENLQRILRKFSGKPLLYLGRKFENLLPKGYNSGGAGYIMSKRAVELMILNGPSFPKDCLTDGGIEDLDIGRCLAKFGIYPEDELDEVGKLTFHSENPFQVLRGDAVQQYFFINFSGNPFGNKETIKARGAMLSEWTATMHYVSPPEMYMYDFLLYYLRRPDAIENI